LQLDVEQGALVTQVEPGSPAEQIGVEVGDVILEVNDDAVQSSTDLRNEIGLIRTGEAVSLTLMHQGMRKTVRTTVAEPPVAAVESEPPAESLEPGVLDGVELSNLPPEHPLFGNVQGVLVVRVQQESAAWRQGLMQNDVVTAVNRMPVASVDELSATLGQIDGPVALHVQRGSRQLFVLIE
jgi:S1-C subfamily serine protease